MAHRITYSVAATTLAIIISAIHLVAAPEPPTDLCALLPTADISQILGRPYGPPKEDVAPKPFANTVTGADCHYLAKGSTLWFRAYADPSPSVAADLFARLSKFYGTPTPVPGLGDEAYVDAAHALHARKGKVRFYLNLDPIGTFTPAVQQQLKDLASKVMGRL